MYLNEVYEFLNLEFKNLKNIRIKSIKTDSREVKKGDLFIALKGDNYDGNNYINEVIEKGASCVVGNIDIKSKVPYIKVSDSYNALKLIGEGIRLKYNIPVIAITGSNGKTTTKELIYFILKDKYKIVKNEGNKNNIIGVFETILNLKESTSLAIFELGMNHLGEIDVLSNMVKPTIGAITNIGTAHIGILKSRKNIFKAKMEILNGMSTNNLIVNGDSKYLDKLNYFKCGINKNNDLVAYNIRSDIDSISFNVTLDKEYEIIYNNPGDHIIPDILLAIKICLNFISIEEIIKRIKKYKAYDKRMEVKKVKDNLIINDCYNASYESVIGGLNYLSKFENKIVIFGDMLELGSYSSKIHKKVAKAINNVKPNYVFTVGEYSKCINGIHFNNNLDLINYIRDLNLHGFAIYVKGSRLMKLEEVVEGLKK